jgi:hypothetical protein
VGSGRVEMERAGEEGDLGFCTYLNMAGKPLLKRPPLIITKIIGVAK